MHTSPFTLTDAAAALRAGRVSSVELTEQAIVTANRLDSTLGVYLARLDDTARRDAERADRELASGLDRGTLHGIPVGVKDNIAVAGVPTTGQSAVTDPSWSAGLDAPVVGRLRAAGAVITGKTSLTEFGCGLPDPAGAGPVPRNPHDPDRWTGGSSSGTASGVAAGMFFAGLGSDTAGSIRMPAAFCGVTGLMPTFGLVPKSGCLPLSYSLDRIGPLAHTARDCAEVLAVITGQHASPAAPAEDLSGLRVGVVRDLPSGTDPAVERGFDAAVAVLAGLGASVRDVLLPYASELVTATFITAVCEGLAYHRGALTSRWDDYTVAARGLLAGGALVSGADYVQAQRVRMAGEQAMAELLDTVDVIACPTAGIGAPPFGQLADEAGTQDNEGVFSLVFTPYWNGLGGPVLALPMGMTADGLPLSMQLAGRAFDEARLLRIGDAFQRHTDWHLRRPALTGAAA
ncbi:amidase [Pseudonocardia spinosispora]|uniref:amidase n=1 Tax=Pseudonocardia spinosispora TaxID=103441 RepID=UPI0004080A0A|nr:amidase [Pseudonocardia spinosispora]